MKKAAQLRKCFEIAQQSFAFKKQYLSSAIHHTPEPPRTAGRLPQSVTELLHLGRQAGMTSAMSPRTSALAVHLFTATGASLAMLALHEAFTRDWAMMSIWLAVALVVDGIDGPLARHFNVKQHFAEIDGVLLDLIIDFLTYVVIPAYALYASGLLPGWSGWIAVLLIPFASAVYFADTRMKTADNSFAGFPGCWNMAVLAMLVIVPPWWVTLTIVILLTAAMFLPLKFIHPVRTLRWRPISLTVSLVWMGAIAWAAWTDFSANAVLTVTVALTSIYLLLAGIAQQMSDPKSAQ